MLLFSFIININYPAGEERFIIYHQTSGFGKSFAEENTTCVRFDLCSLHSLVVSGSLLSRERNDFAVSFIVIFTILHKTF